MKVMLINPPWYRFFGGQMSAYPVGLCYLAAMLERAAIKTTVYNADYSKGNKGTIFLEVGTMTKRHQEYLNALNDSNHPIWQEIEDEIRKESPDVVGITVMTAKYGSALNVARIVKKINSVTPVIFGGVHPTILPTETIQNMDVDIVIRGEGEHTLLEVVKQLDVGGGLNEIDGITYKIGGEPVSNRDRVLLENLDDIPFPARHLLLNNETYPEHSFGLLFTSRGCPFRCTYCASHKVWGRKVRFRSAKNVVEEIKEVSKTYNTKYFSFEDDTFTLDRERVEAICDLLINDKLDILWRCETRAGLLTDELVAKMKKAGCYSIAIGVESGDPITLKRIQKGITKKQVTEISKILKKHGIEMEAYFMIGFPWETAENINNTVSFMKLLDPQSAIYSVATPYPGTKLFDDTQAEGLLPLSIDWSTFYHQSPDMFYSNKVSRDEAASLINMTESVFDKHNQRKRRQKLKHPLSVLRLMYKSGLWRHPHVLFKRLKELVG